MHSQRFPSCQSLRAVGGRWGGVHDVCVREEVSVWVKDRLCSYGGVCKGWRSFLREEPLQDNGNALRNVRYVL